MSIGLERKSMAAVEQAELPIREKHAPEEMAVLERWMQEHGDPADWSEKVRLAYANTIANMRAGGQL